MAEMSDEPNNSQSTPEQSPTKNLLQKIKDRCQRHLHFKFPNHISHPHGENFDWRTRDHQDNIDSQIPVSEKLRLNTVWGMEIFTQNQIPELKKSLKRLGWNVAPTIARPSLIDWLETERGYGSGETFFHIGTARKSPSPNTNPPDLKAPIPNGINRLIVSVHQITESLTGMMIGFVMEESLSRKYETELNTDRTTFFRKDKGQKGYSILDARNQKKEACDNLREAITDEIDKWFEQNMCGFFSSIQKARVPTIELITTQSRQLLLSHKEFMAGEEEPKWHQLLGVPSHFSVWESTSFGNLRFSVDSRTTRRIKYHAFCNIPEDSIKDGELGTYKYSIEDGITHYCHDGLALTLCWFSVIAFLLETKRSIRSLRDVLTTPCKTYTQMKKSLSALENFYGHHIGSSVSISEVKKLSEDYFSFISYDFSLIPHDVDSEDKMLSASLKERIEVLRDETILEEEITREIGTTFTSLVNTRESNKTQRRMLALVIFSIFISLASLHSCQKEAPGQLIKIEIN